MPSAALCLLPHAQAGCTTGSLPSNNYHKVSSASTRHKPQAPRRTDVRPLMATIASGTSEDCVAHVHIVYAAIRSGQTACASTASKEGLQSAQFAHADASAALCSCHPRDLPSSQAERPKTNRARQSCRHTSQALSDLSNSGNIFSHARTNAHSQLGLNTDDSTHPSRPAHWACTCSHGFRTCRSKQCSAFPAQQVPRQRPHTSARHRAAADTTLQVILGAHCSAHKQAAHIQNNGSWRVRRCAHGGCLNS